MHSVCKKSLFCVSIREHKQTMGYVDDTIREARKLGIKACESEGLINRHQIKETLVFEKEAEVFYQ